MEKDIFLGDLKEIESYKRGYGVLRIPNEILHAVLGLPKNVVIDHVGYDEFRKITNIFMSSQGEVQPYTFYRGSTQCTIIADYDAWIKDAIERMREIVKRYDEMMSINEQEMEEER
jgi:hypothetical protein